MALQPVSLVGPADDPAGAVLDLGHHLVGPAAVSGGPWSPGGGEMAFSWWLVLVQGGPMMTVRVSSGVLAANHLAPTQVSWAEFVSLRHTLKIYQAEENSPQNIKGRKINKTLVRINSLIVLI